MPTPPITTRRDNAIADLITFARLAPYLDATGGDLPAALRLYRWNIEMSGAVYKMLHVVEIVLRNTIDAQLRSWNSTQVDKETGHAHSADWTLDPARLLQRLAGRDLVKARQRAMRAAAECSTGSRRMTHDDVIAQLSLGTWRFLLPGTDPGRRRLWRDALIGGFPRLGRPEQGLVTDVDGLHRLRNRVAHLEPLVPVGTVVPHLLAARRVLAAIDPHTEEWLATTQTVTPIAKGRPRR